jgi:cell division GTPase FtsZ
VTSAAPRKAAQGRPAFGLPGRIQAPNSKARTLALVGLGEGGAGIAREIAREGLAHLEVHVLAKSATGGDPLAAIQAGGGDLQRDLMRADMIFLVACRGDDASLAPVVSRIAHSRSHPVTALYIVPCGGEPHAEDETLRTLRSGAEMLVVVSDASYVPAMIHALAPERPQETP